VWPSGMSLSNLKLHETKAVKNICKQEKFILWLTFDPGLALTGFQTTIYNKLTRNEPMIQPKTSLWSAVNLKKNM